MTAPARMSDEDLIAEARATAGYQGYSEIVLELAARFTAALERERLDVEAIAEHEHGMAIPHRKCKLCDRFAAREKEG